MAVPGEVICFCQELTGAASFASPILKHCDSGIAIHNGCVSHEKTTMILLHRHQHQGVEEQFLATHMLNAFGWCMLCCISCNLKVLAKTVNVQPMLSLVVIAHRADSIEAMLAAIPSRFSIQKSLSLDSSSSSRASSRLMAGAHPVPNVVAAVPSMRAVPTSSAASPQPVYGMSAIPSRRSRDVPGLQPEVVALTHTPGAHGGHVTEAMGNGDMPRSSMLALHYIFEITLQYCC